MVAQQGPGSITSGLAPQAAALQVSTTTCAILPAATDVVAFVGRTLKGPVNEPVAIDGFPAFQQYFGGLWAGSLLPHAVEQFFEHGGRHALVVRVASSARAPTIDLPAGGERLQLIGLAPGGQEFLRASVDHDGIGSQDHDLFNLVVQRVRARGSELVEAQEIFRRVSVLPASSRSLGRKLAGSQLVRLAGPPPSVRPDITRGADPRALIGYVECNEDGDDGVELSDYDLIGSEARHSGLFALAGGPAFNFLYMPPPTRERDLGMSALVVGARFCRRQQALLLVDPPHAWTTVQRAREGLADWPFHSADALMFFPRIVSTDRLTGQLAQFPPSAAALGTLLRDGQEQVWREGGENLLRPTATPAAWVDRMQRTRLAARGVNALRATRTPGRETVAPCTLAGELGRGAEACLLSERRLTQHLCASIERGTRWVLVDGNTPRGRERAARQVGDFLQGYAEGGAFAGTLRGRDYFVICDERLNGPLEQASGVFLLIFGYQSARAPTRLAFLVEHRPGGSQVRAVSLNQLAALG